MLLSHGFGPVIAFGVALHATTTIADVRWHPEPDLNFPTSSTFEGVPDALPLLRTVVEIMNRHGYSLMRVDMDEGIIGGKRQIDGNTSEMVLFRLTRGIEEDQSIQLEWLYGEYVVAFGNPEPRRVVVKQETDELANVIKEVQLAILLNQ